MAVNVNVIGRLGADAEIRSTNGGSQYVAFRMATDEFKNKERTTTWLNVFDYTERGIKLAQYLKKGTMLNIFGTETVNVYQSKQTGEWLPSRDIRVYNFDFVSSGTQNQNDGANGTQQVVTTTTSSNNNTVSVTPTTGTFTPPQSTPSFATVTNDDSDDLPF